MVIKASAAAEVATLVNALAGADEIAREAAVARLSVIGGRAVDKLHHAYAAATLPATRVAILRTLEAIPDQRNLALAKTAAAAGGDVGVAAVGVLRSLLGSDPAPTATGALDELVTIAVAADGNTRLRVAALDALADVPGGVRSRITAALGSDPGEVKRLAALEGEARQDAAAWQDAIDGRLPDDPRGLREAVRTRAAAAPLNSLRKLIDAVRLREAAADGAAREAWQGLRGALHQALALRGSRVALYDLRESIATNGDAIPPSFLAALHVVGDDSCLEPLAAAWSSAVDERWQYQLAAAFQAIAKRERISRRHATGKRIVARSPAAAALWG